MLKFSIVLLVVTLLQFSIAYPFIGESRIVGGTDATIEEIPWQVSIHYYPVNHCGGSIINHYTILTAAHCFYETGTDPEAYRVRAGTSVRSNGGEMYDVEEIIVHPEFNITTYNFDIALIKLTSKINYTKQIQPIPLAEIDENLPVGEYGVVSGFGKLGVELGFPTNLQMTYLEVLDQEICKQKYEGSNNITENMFCAGGNGINDACGGDSGGPFVVHGKLYGITSHGIKCALQEYPGVFTRVSTFRQWIEDNL